jgi:hypothetical protein
MMMEKFEKFVEYITDEKLLIGFALGLAVGALLRCLGL